MKGISKTKRDFVINRDGARCQMCGIKVITAAENEKDYFKENFCNIDHIKPRSKGGTNSVDNIRVLCRKCNSKKSDLSIKDVIKRLNKIDFKVNTTVVDDLLSREDKNLYKDLLEY